MSEDPKEAAPVQVPPRTRIGFAAVSLLLVYALIGWVVVAGQPANSLHQSALSWAFVLAGGILASMGLAPHLEKVLAAKFGG